MMDQNLDDTLQENRSPAATRYDGLPPVIKGMIDRNAFNWLPDTAKNTIIADMCEPEPDAEDAAG